MQTECLVTGDAQTRLEVRVRFLHLLERAGAHGEITWQPTWQEAIEREVIAPQFALDTTPQQISFAFSGEQAAGRQEPIKGRLEIAVTPVAAGLFKLRVEIVNETVAETAALSHEEMLLRALVSTHTILGVHAGEFVSLLNPPGEWRAAAAACRNVGTYPVLVGTEAARDCLLSSPIILYDYPQIAPESAGTLFDGTEIDEILTLRILTLTEEEKRELRAGDARARELLERTETLSTEQLLKLHGAWRGLRQGAR
jgi:hydrogenase maturation protease